MKTSVLLKNEELGVTGVFFFRLELTILTGVGGRKGVLVVVRVDVQAVVLSVRKAVDHCVR